MKGSSFKEDARTQLALWLGPWGGHLVQQEAPAGGSGFRGSGPSLICGTCRMEVLLNVNGQEFHLSARVQVICHISVLWVKGHPSL